MQVGGKRWNKPDHRKRPKLTSWHTGHCCPLTGWVGVSDTLQPQNPTVHLITARPESIFNGRQQRKRDRGWREEGSKAEREGTAVAMECGKSTKWWQWRICSSSTLLFKGLFPFHFTGSHFTSKNLCVFGECVGEFCVCGVNASRSAWRRGCAGQAC